MNEYLHHRRSEFISLVEHFTETLETFIDGMQIFDQYSVSYVPCLTSHICSKYTSHTYVSNVICLITIGYLRNPY